MAEVVTRRIEGKVIGIQSMGRTPYSPASLVLRIYDGRNKPQEVIALNQGTVDDPEAGDDLPLKGLKGLLMHQKLLWQEGTYGPNGTPERGTFYTIDILSGSMAGRGQIKVKIPSSS